MVRFIAALILLLTVFIFGTIAEKKEAKEWVPLNYVVIDTSLLTYKQQAYVPVNLPSKKVRQKQKIVLKVRNTSFTDSIYLNRVDYYDSKGALLSNILDSALLIEPMATGEIMIGSQDLEKSGDSLIVQWLSNSISKPLVQAIAMDVRNRVIMNEQGTLLSDELTTNQGIN